MDFRLTKQQLISLFILVGLIFIFPLALVLTRQRQEIRKKAAGTRQEIKITLDPASKSTISPGETFKVTVKLKNIASGERKIRVAGVELKFDPNVLTISQISCGSSLPSSAFTDIINNNTIRLICYKPGEAAPNLPLSIGVGSTIELGSFQVTVKTSTGTDFIFTRTNVPEDTSLEDLSDGGASAHYGPTGTATPTIPPSTPTPTPTIPPGCPKGDIGDLNCNGNVEILDLNILLGSWSPDGPAPTPMAGRHSPDIAPPGNLDNKVNILDLNRLLGNWGK